MNPENMEKSMTHFQKLASKCRTCGVVVVKATGYKNPKQASEFRAQILELFGVDVCQEDSRLPKLLCSTCKRKLDRCRAAKKKVLSQSHMLPDFPLVCLQNCLICSTKRTVHNSFSVIFAVSECMESHTISSPPSSPTIPCPTILVPPKDVDTMAAGLGFVKIGSAENLKIFAKIHVQSNAIPVIVLSIALFEDGTWTVHAYNVLVPKSCAMLSGFPEKVNEQTLYDVLLMLKDCSVCIGNPDFPSVVARQRGKGSNLVLTGKDGSISATIENSQLSDFRECQTIRSVGCEILVGAALMRCHPCQQYRPVLRSIAHRCKMTSLSASPKKFARNSFMSHQQIVKKAKKLQASNQAMKKKLSIMEKRIEQSIHYKGIQLDETSTIVEAVMSESTCPFPKDSPQFLLWQQQAKQASLKNRKSMRWHPVLVRWCLSIYLDSPGTYQRIRKSGFIELPDRTTLLRYANFTEAQCGFNVDVIKLFCDDQKVELMTEMERNVALLYDEMKIKSGLIFSRSSGKLVGFTQLGSLNAELEEFGKCMENGYKERDIATHVLTFMVRGLFRRFECPIGYFASQGFTAYQLYPRVWEATGVLESIGLHVRCFVSDGASPNRKFYKMHELPGAENVSEDGVVYWTTNRFDLDRKIYFICDAPHLIKTVRNNLENSFGHKMTRCLTVGGQEISWQHIVRLYEEDCGLDRAAPGLRKLHKLTEDHINLNPRLRMRVYLAAQVLSESVSNALAMQNDFRTVATRTFILMFDKFFDCLNSNYKKNDAKPNRKPYKSLEDDRLKWLNDEFLRYINDWERQCQEIASVSKEYRNRLCLTRQTLEGLRTTVHSFVELAAVLLALDDVKFFLSDKLNQDPLEEHFGRQRMRGGANENPSLEEYGLNENKLIVSRSVGLQNLKGTNVRGKRPDPERIDTTDQASLPKRKK